MINVNKDIEVEVRISSSGKRLAFADLTICGIATIYNFEIVKANNNKIYVVNPHTISSVFNKASYKKELMYVSNASLLPSEYRKAIIDKILDKFAEELDKVQKNYEETNVKRVQNVGTGSVVIKD